MPGCVVVALFPIYSVYNPEISVTFLMTMTKYLARRNLRKGGFILAHSLKGVHFPLGKWKRYTEDLQVFDIKFCCFGNGANIKSPSCGWGGSLLPGPKQTSFGRGLLNQQFKVEMTLPAAWYKVYWCDQHGVHLLCTMPCPLARPPTSCATCSRDGFSSSRGTFLLMLFSELLAGISLLWWGHRSISKPNQGDAGYNYDLSLATRFALLQKPMV